MVEIHQTGLIDWLGDRTGYKKVRSCDIYHIVIYLKLRTLPDPTQMRATEGETDNRRREGTLYLSRVSHRHCTTHLHRFSQFYCCRRHVGFPWLHCICPDTTVKYWILGSTLGTSINRLLGHDLLHTVNDKSPLVFGTVQSWEVILRLISFS